MGALVSKSPTSLIPLAPSFRRHSPLDLFQLPIAAVSLTDCDRQWFKSRVGVEHDSIPRMRAPCGQVADSSEVLVLPDLREDAYYRDSLLAASGIRYYAGAPLITTGGHCLGAICILGTEPRTTTEQDARHAKLLP
jgi:GAF domain-containing protein